MDVHVTSSAFREGEAIPAEYTCEGRNVSPPLAWSAVPAGTRSFALICEDPDAPSGLFIHWVLFNVPPQITSLEPGVPASEKLETGAVQGRNSGQKVGYSGPCPPPGKPHRYFFRVYALDTTIEVRPGATRDQVTGAMEGHILSRGQLMGTYQRQAGR